MTHSLDDTQPASQLSETHDNDVFAKYYDELAPKFLDYDRARAEFKRIVDVRRRCLELGIGTGLFAQELINDGYSIDGVEPSKEMLAKLSAKAAEFKTFPKLIEAGVDSVPGDAEYDYIFSHSGPFFFVSGAEGLHFEGLRHDQLKGADPRAFHKGVLQKFLKIVAARDGAVLCNIQQDRTDIPLAEGNVMFKYDRIGEYDATDLSVVKFGRFVNPATGEIIQPKDPAKHSAPYKRFAWSAEQMEEMLQELGDVSMETRGDIWVVLKPLHLNERLVEGI